MARQPMNPRPAARQPSGRSVISAKRSAAAAKAAGVLPAPPANTALPTISGTAQVGQVLTGTVGTWTGYPAPTFTRQWKAAGVNIAGATSMNYTPVAGDVGKTLTFTATGTNIYGSASATSAPTAAVIA